MDGNDRHPSSESSSSGFSSSHVTATSNGDTASNRSTRFITKEERRLVLISKLVAFAAIFTAAVALSIVTFRSVETAEQKEFLEAFALMADKVVTGISEDILLKIESSYATAYQISSYASDKKHVWPNITLPHYETIGNRMNQLSKAELSMLLPIVRYDERDSWGAYSTEKQNWIIEGLAIEFFDAEEEAMYPGLIPPSIWTPPNSRGTTSGFAAPLWQTAPTPRNASVINQDLDYIFTEAIDWVIHKEQSVLTGAADIKTLLTQSGIPLKAGPDEPRQMILNPIFKDTLHRGFHEGIHSAAFGVGNLTKVDEHIGGFVATVTPWRESLTKKLPKEINGLYVHVQSACDVDFTYVINGWEAIYVGEGDGHDSSYDAYAATYDLSDQFRRHGYEKDYVFGKCPHVVTFYPSSEFESVYVDSASPWAMSIKVSAAFAFTILAFIVYDWYINRQKKKLEDQATKTAAIVDSIFPKEVQERMMNNNGNGRKGAVGNFKVSQNNELETNNNTIADFFPAASVLFADIVGFTAWSSAREPAQVFTLLETVFSQFDDIAKKRRIFKVETVGDCYVAAAGIPTARKDHAVAMARFARDCQNAFICLVRELETQLGPDTADLGMRFGLHSGPITAGVLRGDRARFQLFGDTMNTAARIESNGEKNRIHVSEDTANEIKAAGKGHWVIPREDKIIAKGKGELQTFWLELRGDTARSCSATSETSDDLANEKPNIPAVTLSREEKSEVKASKEKLRRLVEWNSEILMRQLERVIWHRRAIDLKPSHENAIQTLELDSLNRQETVLNEVKEIVVLPDFQETTLSADCEPLGKEVSSELNHYVETIGAMYQQNPFHNFEHASHVSMSVTKFLSRIVAPSSNQTGEIVHDNTYGITSDPLVQFAATFSALIHDADHPGVPNSQLVKEQTSLASYYEGRSIAEQNSIDLAWELLMDPQFKNLRRAIYTTETEFNRFRQLVVNSVMATDIMDKDLKALRNGRWEKAFSQGSEQDEESSSDARNRKATIVIEHLIQASDVAHTMQHWHIYRKWNERLFEELYKAYVEGRSTSNPADFWYDGEIGFMDHYVIPLAKKLKDCGVFGVSSDECLNYAIRNREQWTKQGKEVVEAMIEKFQSTYVA